ncbi:MAG: 16S rRNA (adenine(1518)-N(6)/adenine(1519)-N(6))-dimethyltransferase RsmA [Bacteroidales bacterium]|jgi:16S rRNA (adenine1518-N6/adenine1519-N6)-dimethyltransferase|nr:16S rRNA (adenine(1518)-N(6)/adenine(1519)-N(6))-dimethyltransferase RsmA [Bacteroidales bacterium]
MKPEDNDRIKAKKYLGQHFLIDKNIAEKIADSLLYQGNVLEIGPGMGILTAFLLKREHVNLAVIEIDGESVDYLHKYFPDLRVIQEDFLKFDLSVIFQGQFAIIGNFPYNISAPILFRLLAYRRYIPEFTGMLQKEVAERIAQQPGSKEYGILSVLLQTFYEAKYLFTVNETVFNPPPKVKSGVIRLTRKEDFNLDCDEKLYFNVVKTAFNQRRKTLRNSLKGFEKSRLIDSDILRKRPEQLPFEVFIEITKQISN